LKEKSFERKQELLDAALEEFISQKYNDASINVIIKKAGISKGTFYYHFRDKQALYLFILESAVRAKWDFLRSEMAERASEFEGKDIFEKFKLQAEIGVRFAVSHPMYYKLGIMFGREKGNPIYEIAINHLGDDGEAVLEEMIQAAIEAGDFRSGFSNDFIQKVITHSMKDFDAIFLNNPADFDLDKMLKNLNDYVDFMKYGLGNA
jgi:AcrR family transcriptional regulator